MRQDRPTSDRSTGQEIRRPWTPTWTKTAATLQTSGISREAAMLVQHAKMTLVAARERPGGDTGVLTRILTQYPQYALELTEFSTALAATTSYEHEPLTSDITARAARARQRAWMTVFPPQATVRSAADVEIPTGAATTLTVLRRRCGRTLLAVAQELRLGVDVLSDLEAGLISVTTIPNRLVSALGEVLHVTRDRVRVALQTQGTTLPTLQRSTEGSRSSMPQLRMRDFSGAVASSPNMSQEQRTYWLNAE